MAAANGGEYAWERAYERTWEALNEDAEGRLTVASRKRSVAETSDTDDKIGAVQRGMLRYCVLVLDASAAMLGTDLLPTRLSATCTAATQFAKEWFDQNPVGSMSLVCICKNVSFTLVPLTSITRRICEALAALSGDRPTDASGAPAPPVPAVAALGGAAGTGAFSMQASLEASLHELSLVPAAGHKEVLLLHAALSSVDAGDVTTAIAAAAAKHVAVHVVGLAGEVYLSKKTSQDTGGSFAVAESYDHLVELLKQRVPPPPAVEGSAAAQREGMALMGFPRLVAHAAVPDNTGHVRQQVYLCPRCGTAARDLPSTCTVCALPLAAAAQLARSSHHLRPLTPFVRVPSATTPSAPTKEQMAAVAVAQVRKETSDTAPATSVVVSATATQCMGCRATLSAADPRVVCQDTLCVFCEPCGVFMREQLHNNPAVCV